MPFYQTDLTRVLFLDIETVSAQAEYQDLSPETQALWADKTAYQRGEEYSPAEYYPRRAAILAEFGKVVCVSCGFFSRYQEGEREFRLTSFFGDDERDLLERLGAMLHKMTGEYTLCAHNGKEFDFPYLARRMVIHGLPLPPVLNTSGLKPWQVPHLDTLELWKFGDYKNFTSLKLLAHVLGLPTPKDDIDGSMVGTVYWQERDLQRIVTYCEKDVITLARVLLRMENQANLSDDEIEKAALE